MIKRIPGEIKEEILIKARAGERVISLAKQYGISDRIIYGWLRRDTGEDVISILKYNKLKRENQELKRFNHIGEPVEAIYTQVHYYNFKRRHTAFKMSPVEFAIF